jgi:glutamyl-tRNA reductase
VTVLADASDPTLDLIALVTHARDVTSEAREAFAAAAAPVAGDPRAILVHPCHRVGLYVVAGTDSRELPGPLPELPAGGRRLDGMVAARHLFTVAAGLDSVVVGEDQILHQLRESLSDRRLPAADRCPVDVGSSSSRAGTLDPVLERLFQVALHLGRETRSWREGPPRSLADVVIDRLTPITGLLAGRRLLVVGAGRMARLVAIAAAREGAGVLIANRSRERAEALAHDAGGEVVSIASGAPVPDVDAVVLAIGGPWSLSPTATTDLLARTLPVVDLSSPPAVSSELRDRLGPRYTSIDDLARGPQDALRARMRHRYERGLVDAEASFASWVRTRTAVPAIQALSDLAEERRSDELERLFRRVELDDHERELVVQMSHRLVAGLLHAPLVSLRDDPSGELEHAARALFSL